MRVKMCVKNISVKNILVLFFETTNLYLLQEHS